MPSPTHNRRIRSIPVTDGERELREDIARLSRDPLAFVKYAFQWGHGDLAKWDGPDEWQAELLTQLGEELEERGFLGGDAVDPVRMAVASGHGVGKSALVAWIILFIMATRPGCKGTVTASTASQLSTKTQPELSLWLSRCICKHWFRLDSDKIVGVEDPDNWRGDFRTARKEESEAFAGQHKASSCSWYVFDEGSGVDDKIYEVAEGGLTDGEPMMFVFGNPTRPKGYFHRIFTKLQHRWLTFRVDSRNARMTNKAELERWRQDWGDDSDFFRVRVKGEFPGQAAEQLISRDSIAAARHRSPRTDVWDPMVLGVDVARYGEDRSVIAFRKGNDARTHPARVYQKLDLMELASRVVEAALEVKADAVFIDGGGVGGGLVDRCRQLGLQVIEVNFGSSSSSREAYNKRTEMWCALREALNTRLAIEDLDGLEEELAAQEYFIDPKTRRTRLVSKEELHELDEPSPDHGDALALTYAHPVTPSKVEARAARGARTDRPAYHPLNQLAR